MAQHSPFRESGRSRCVLNLRRVIRRKRRQRLPCAGLEVHSRRVRQVHDVTDIVEAGNRLFRDVAHRVAAELVDHEQSDRPRLFEDIAQSVRLEGGISRDKDQPGKPAGVLHEDPFGDIRRPDAMTFSPGENLLASDRANRSVSASNVA